MPKHNEPQYKTKANAIGVRYAYTRVDGQQVALGRAGEAAWDKYLSILEEWRAHAAAGDAKARDWLSKYLMPQPGSDEGGGLRPLVVEFVEAIPGERELVEDQR